MLHVAKAIGLLYLYLGPNSNNCKKNLAVYNAFKDDIRHLTGLKQQI